MDRPISLEARRIDLAIEPAFQLGGTRVDPPAHEITFAGKSARIQPQTLKVLIALHDRIGEVVTRDELADRCWDGRIIGEDVVNRCVSLLRRFAAEAGGFRIETVHRSGYRLTEMHDAELGSKRWLWAVAGAALMTASAGLYIVNEWPRRGEGGALTVAVLPLREDSPGRDIQEVAAATRASVSNALEEGGYPAALVDQPPDKRPADFVISGDIRRAASTVQAIIQVGETRHGVIVYSHRFETNWNSAAALPDQIGASVAASLSEAAALMRLDRRYPSDAAVAAQVLNGLTLDGGVPLHGYEVARQIAPKAPESAIAQYGLALETGNILADLPRDQRVDALALGRLAADRVLALAPDFGDAYGLWCSLHNPILLGQCEDHLREGLRIDPSAPHASDGLSALLNAVGRIDEAQQLGQISLAKDPLNPFKLARMIRILESEGDTTHAERLFRQSVRWWPNNPVIYWSRLVGIESRGDYPAVETFASQVGDDKLPLNRDTAIKVIAAAKAHDRKSVALACAKKGLRWTTQWLCLTELANLGDRDQAFAIAYRLFPPLRGRNAAEEERSWLDQPSAFSVSMLSSPAAASLRRDPRFLDLADGSGLLVYWRSGRLPDFCRINPEPICAQILRGRA